MTAPSIESVPGVTPVVQLGIGTRAGASGTIGQWSDSTHTHTRWATSTATASYGRWGGEDPSWWDVSCYVQDVVTFNGRERAGDPFDIGTATIICDNTDGWADYQYPVDPATEGELSVRPGRAIRVGVSVNGSPVQWLFRGFVDQANPSYMPDAGPAITFECIDVKGEVGRVELPALATAVGASEGASTRIGRILNAVNWSMAPYGTKRDIDPSTIPLVATEMGGKVTDLLDITADSSGGVVFGDTEGRVVYRNRDWQTITTTLSPDATISNLGAPATPPTPGDPVVIDEDPNGSGLYVVVSGAVMVEDPVLSGLYRPEGDELMIEDPAGLYELFEFGAPGLPADVCPSGWEVVAAREDIATRTQAGRVDDETSVITKNDLDGQSMFGIETFSKLDLETVADIELDNLALRYARIRSWKILPRIAAVTIVADSRQPQTLELLATATPYKPSLYRCIHQVGAKSVLNNLMFVTGVEHTLNPDGWTARIALDSAQPWMSDGGRWNTTGYWHGPTHTTTWQPAA